MIVNRSATSAELEQVLGWAAIEGWNPGLADAEAFHAADPKGFFVACEDKSPIAAISVVNHNDSFAFLGLYIVRPAWRGQGIGLNLWTQALAHAGARVVGLDGVPDQQENYKSSGFVHAGATTRFTGAVSAQTHAGIAEIVPEDVPGLVAQEAAASGASKPDYLGAWFRKDPQRITLADKSSGTPAAFCTLRRCRTGAKLGPFLAPDRAAAERLVEHAAGLAEGPLTIDVPAGSHGLKDICQALGMQAGFETARMYRGQPAPPKTPSSFFAVTSLELG